MSQSKAGLYRRVTGRPLYAAGKKPEVQHAVKEVAGGMTGRTLGEPLLLLFPRARCDG